MFTFCVIFKLMLVCNFAKNLGLRRDAVAALQADAQALGVALLIIKGQGGGAAVFPSNH